MVVAWLVGGVIGFLLARMPFAPMAPQRIVVRARSLPDWNTLPSGFSRQYSFDFVGYVSPTDDGAHWWISRRGRTIIEGPAANVLMAKHEVEKAAADFYV